MEKGIFVKDIKPGMETGGIFIIVNPALRTSSNGPYWQFLLADATGAIDTKIWPPKSAEFENIPSGVPAYALGRAETFRDSLQIKLADFYILQENEHNNLNMRDFLPCSSRSAEDMFMELGDICANELKYKLWKNLVFSVLQDDNIKMEFALAPAAKSVHQAYLGGLLEHTLNVAKLCMSICSRYPALDRQLLLAGAIFHDIGKIREFSWKFAIEYTTEGNLLGHLNLGLDILAPFLEKSKLDAGLILHLKHLILSHHGQYEYGSPRLPQTAEAFALHYADNLDARQAQCQELFQNKTEPGWSAWQRTLDRPVYKPLPTPAQPLKAKQELSCLLPLKE